MVEVVKNLFEFLKKKDTIDPLKTLFEDVKKNIPKIKTDLPKTTVPALPEIPKQTPVPSITPGRRPVKGRKQKKKKPLWDIPGISSVEKAEIMRIVSETQRIKDETDEQIRMLVPDYKKPKPKKPQPVRRTQPAVVTKQTEPPAKRREIKAPIVDKKYDRPLPPPPVEDDEEEEEEEQPPPLPPRAPPRTPPRAPVQVPQYQQQYYQVPPPPEEEAPEPPMEVEEISVPVKQPYRSAKPSLLDEIRQGTQLRHVETPITTGVSHPADLAKVLQRRVYVAPSDDEDEAYDDEWNGYGRSQGPATAPAFTTPEEFERWKHSWGAYI